MALTTGLFGEDSGTITAGQRQTGDVAATTVGRDVPQWIRDLAVNVSENVAPLTAMLERKGASGKKTVAGYKYNHLEDDIQNRWVEDDGAGHTDAETTFDVAAGHGARVKAYDTLHNPATGEILLITAVLSNALTVERGAGSSTAAAIAAGQDLEIGPSAFLEGSAAPASITSEPNIKTNYTQTTKAAVELSGRLLSLATVGGDEEQMQLKKVLKGFQVAKETGFLHGARKTDDPTMTGGLDYYISTNSTDASGALTEATINTFIKDVYRRNQGGAGNMVLFAGELLLDAFDSHARDAVRYRPDDKVLGISVGRLKNSHGEVAVAKHGLLTVNATLSGIGYLVNLDKIKIVEMKGRGFQHKTHIETPGTDSSKHLFLSDWGVWMAAEKSHGKLYGVTG